VAAVQTAVQVEHVTKRFRLLHDHNSTLKATILRGFRRAHYEEFLALDDVSLAVPAGSTYGLIGQNGSGKSTLLKCMARIYRPDLGSITVEGKTSALLELGAGFHPELSGRENVYLNGSILGMSKRELDLRFDDIVSFAGLERFIDTPVKNYSSGMYVRLGFSVAINVEPEVLLVDEVLAVGDESFQTRCNEKFADLRRSGCTIVVVSHGMDQMRSLCDRVAWLDGGVVQSEGPAGAVIDEYLRAVRSGRNEFAARNRAAVIEAGEDPLIESVELLDADGNLTELLRTGAPATIRVTFDQGRIGEPVSVALALFRVDGSHITSLNSGGPLTDGTGDRRQLLYRIPSLPVINGRYALSVALHDAKVLHVFERADRVAQFEIEPDPEVTYPQRGVVALGGTWHTS
jgi:ABC-2 type transport system ATP-binding protein